jgi:hypothetical protein
MVKGRVKTYYAMRKSPFGSMQGMSFNLGHSGRTEAGKSGEPLKQGGGAGTNLMKFAGGGPPGTADIEAAVASRRSDELGKLTPEQRVQRARDRQQSKQKQ